LERRCSVTGSFHEEQKIAEKSEGPDYQGFTTLS